MDNNNNPSAGSGHGNNFLSGFLLGALVGAAIVLLFVTKKGKKILKAISEEGEGKISNILNKIEHSVDLEDVTLEDEPSFASTSAKATVDKKASEGRRKLFAQEEKFVEDRPKVRRFFKGISRRLN